MRAFLGMRMRGLEPPRSYLHTDLNRARLPIPPHPQTAGDDIARAGLGEARRRPIADKVARPADPAHRAAGGGRLARESPPALAIVAIDREHAFASLASPRRYRPGD
jgi:hypothetical protein